MRHSWWPFAMPPLNVIPALTNHRSSRVFCPNMLNTDRNPWPELYPCFMRAPGRLQVFLNVRIQPRDDLVVVF